MGSTIAPTTALRRPRVLATLLALATAVIGPGLAYRAATAQAGPPPPAGLPACRIGDLPAATAGYDDWARTLLDTEYRLGPDYAPPDLVEFAYGGRSVQLGELVLPDLRAMLDAAQAEGASIRLTSGYRSHGYQSAVFDRVARDQGKSVARRLVARPGHSEHQLGTTLDLAGDRDWLATNAWRFGFVMSYPPGRSPQWTCYGPEPWHYRYFGRARAAAIQASGLSPREYLWLEQQAGRQPPAQPVLWSPAATPLTVSSTSRSSSSR